MITSPSTDTTVAHIRRTVDGKESKNGGYTMYCVERTDGKFKVTLCQCNVSQQYNEQRGEAIARKRSEEGKFFIMSTPEILTLVAQLQEKLAC